jgi:hypothetical protein
MSERISLPNAQEIREWGKNNGFDEVNLESDSPRFFQQKFTATPGPQLLFMIEHVFKTAEGQPLVSVKRVLRATTAEDALHQYFQEPRERTGGNEEYSVGFKVHAKPGAGGNETITVMKMAAQ